MKTYKAYLYCDGCLVAETSINERNEQLAKDLFKKLGWNIDIQEYKWEIELEEYDEKKI